MLYEYDATHDKCPLPLVKMRVILNKMQQQDACMIRIADKGSKKDIPKLLNKQGYRYTMKAIGENIVELHIQHKKIDSQSIVSQ
jgi:tRNA 2-thiouridine synthesizing protein A